MGPFFWELQHRLVHIKTAVFARICLRCIEHLIAPAIALTATKMVCPSMKMVTGIVGRVIWTSDRHSRNLLESSGLALDANALQMHLSSDCSAIHVMTALHCACAHLDRQRN